MTGVQDLDGPSRYHRQMILPGIGPEGQARIRAGRVAVVGCGALGSVAVDLLARAGVGELILIDRDLVEATNLQRQVLYTEQDVRACRPKAVAAAEAVARINHEVAVRVHVADLRAANALDLLADADVIVDGLDSFETRYLLNDVAVVTGRAYVYGGAVGTGGLSVAILPAGSPRWPEDQATACLRCLFEEPPPPGTGPTCDSAGILAPVSVTVAARQVAETLKLLAGRLDALDRRMLSVDLWHGTHRGIALDEARRPDCPCCGRREFHWLAGRGETESAVLCGREAVQVRPAGDAPVDLARIAAGLETHGPVIRTTWLVRGALGPEHPGVDLTLFADGRALLHGISDPELGRRLYARVVGC
ncbi:MAG: ThiF family adenylyltransferase [Planctomycetota bacterium]|jgi:adenylyltransferase/sulfurtransferase